MTYTPQRAQLFYLAIVFMWDKLKNFPLTPPCAKMPPGCGREDEEGDDSSKTPVPTKSNKRIVALSNGVTRNDFIAYAESPMKYNPFSASFFQFFSSHS